MSQRIILTDANYGTPLPIVAAHISATSIVAETTYRDGMIPDGAFRRTLVYTLGGNCLSVRESATEIWALVDGIIPASPQATPEGQP